MSAFTASGAVTTDWPSLLQSPCLYENYNYGTIFPQAIPINMTLTGTFPAGFPVGVNIDVIGPADNTLMAGMSFPVPSQPRDMFSVYPVGCIRKNKNKCLLTNAGNGTLSAVTSAVTPAAAQTFLFYVFLPTLFPGWFDVKYRVTFGFLDTYFYPNGTQVNNTLSGTVTWPAPIDFTVRKRTTSEGCDSVCDGIDDNLVVPFNPSSNNVANWFDLTGTVNVNSAPVLNNLDFQIPRDIGIRQRSSASFVATTPLAAASEDPNNATVVTIVYANSEDFPRAPFADKLKLVVKVSITSGTYVVAYSLDNTTYSFLQTQVGIADGNSYGMSSTFAEPTAAWMRSSGTFDCINGDFQPDVRDSTEPVSFVELTRGTSTYMTIKAWSTAGNLTVTKYLRLDYLFPDPDPTLSLFNLNNYQDGRANFPITTRNPSFSLTTTKNEPFVLSVGRVASSPSTVFNVAADLYLNPSDTNAITNTVTGSSSIVNGIAWFNIPVTSPLFLFPNGPANKIVVRVTAQDAINFVLSGPLVRNITAYTANYTFVAYNGTTQNILAELSPGDNRLTFNPFSQTQQVNLRPIDSSGKPAFPLLAWTVTYANSFVNANFGPANPIFYLNGDANTEIVTTNSDSLLPYVTYPLRQNYLTIKVRETNFTVLLNISSSLYTVAWEVSYDGTNFFPVEGVAPFDFTTLTTVPVAVNQSAQALRLTTSFDTSAIALDYSFTLSGAVSPTTGTISSNGSTTITLPGQGLNYLFNLKAGNQGSYDYAVSQAPYRNFNQLSALTSSVGTFAPTFAAATTDYNLTVPFNTTSVSFSANVDASATVTASAIIINLNNASDVSPYFTFLFRYVNGLAEITGLNPSAATAPYIVAIAFSVQSENPALPATLYTVSIFVAPRVLSADSSLSALSVYPTNVASFAPATLSYTVVLPYPETLFKVSGSVNTTSASGVRLVSELFNITSSTVLSLISNTTVTLSNVGAWESANISAATANTSDLAVRVTARVTAENNGVTNYVVNVKLGAAPVVPSSSTGNAGPNTTSSSSTGNGGSNTTSSSTGNGGSTSSTGTNSGSGTVVTSSSSTGNGGSNVTTSSSTGACVPGQTGCNSAYARAAVGMASPFAILMAIMAILLLA